MPCHIGVIASIVLLVLRLVSAKLFMSQLIEAKQQVVADTFVLLATVVEMGESRLVKFACVLSQSLCIVSLSKAGLPQGCEFYISLRQTTDELLIEKGDVEEHVVTYDWPLGFLQHLHNASEAQLFLVAVINLGQLLFRQILMFRLRVIQIVQRA